jgi:predicted RNA-binding protein with PUA-like domain
VAYWLFKTEPGTFSWDDQVRKGSEHWDGVRNHQAANNMRAMKKGDLGLFYHSGEERQVVGTVEVVREAYPDPTDPSGKFVMVDVTARAPMKTPVTLAAIKADPAFADFLLVRHSRLSVVPVSHDHWRRICRMGGIAT